MVQCRGLVPPILDHLLQPNVLQRKNKRQTLMWATTNVQSLIRHPYKIKLPKPLKVDAKEGDTIDVFCSNTDIEFRTDYNSAKFSGFLVKQM